MTHPIRSLRIESYWDGKSLPAEEWISIHLLLSDLGLEVRLDAPFYGDPKAPSCPIGPTDKLWEHEVVEIFILGDDGQYTEIEMAPSGHHLVLQLDGVRNAIATLQPLEFDAVIQGKRWTGVARIGVDLIPQGPLRVNATAIHGSGANRTYLSWIPLCGDEPDFHQPDRFKLLF